MAKIYDEETKRSIETLRSIIAKHTAIHGSHMSALDLRFRRNCERELALLTGVTKVKTPTSNEPMLTSTYGRNYDIDSSTVVRHLDNSDDYEE